LTPRGREAGIVHLGNFPDEGAGFGAAGLTSWSMAIRTVGAQQVGDAPVAGRMLGGGELGAVHRPHLHCDSIALFYGTARGNTVTEGAQSRRIDCHRNCSRRPIPRTRAAGSGEAASD
jgi:hypothetical protein